MRQKRGQKSRKIVISQEVALRMSGLGSPSQPLHFFDTFGQLGAYADDNIKVTIEDISNCLEAVKVHGDTMISVKKAISVSSKFLAILFSPATQLDVDVLDVAAPSPMTTDEHLHKVDYEGILLNIFFFSLIYNYVLQNYVYT